MKRSDLSITTNHVRPQGVVVVKLGVDVPLLLGVALFKSNTGGEGPWKPVETFWIHCRLWIIVPSM